MTKIIIANKSSKQALTEWDEFLESIRNATPVDQSETEEQKRERIKRLEAPGNHEEWIAYYFPKFAFAPPAQFQKDSTNRIFAAKNKFYQSRKWARGLAKSTRRMMEIFYLSFARKMQTNMLLCSKSEENAIRLLAPYRANMEANSRLINDYGTQERSGGKWKENDFTTRTNKTFRAVGSGQNPRGAKNEELRINVIVFDDIDDDEVCRNEIRLDGVWSWVQDSVIPTVEISRMYYIFVDNNVIAEDCIALRAAEYADDSETVNIRDENGKSTWPQKNSEEIVDNMLSNISYESQQKEYFNNPFSTGKAFKEVKWGECPPIKKAPFVVIYADPATSNKDKPTLKSKANNSMKAVFVVAPVGLNYYVYTGYLDNMGTSAFIDCLYACNNYVGKAATTYTYIENNGLQNPFFEQVLLPGISSKKKEKGYVLHVIGDDREKGDKWTRIEGTLEPINRLGYLIFNIKEQENEHMKRLIAQLKNAKATARSLDGPDALEGAIHKIKEKQIVFTSGAATVIKRPKNSKRL